MENGIHQIRQQLSRTLFCGHCKHSNLLIWEATRSGEPPTQSAMQENAWYVIHCDYFKRRIEYPDRLKQCAAYRRRHKSTTEDPDT